MSSEWADARLEDLITVKHGFAFKGEHFTDQSTVHQLVTPGNFAIGGGFQLGKPKFYSGPVPPDYVLNRGDVVVTMTDLSRGGDTLGFAGVVPETPGTVWLHNQRIGLVQLKPGAPVRAGYLHYMMRSVEYRHWVVSTATGSTVKHTSPGRICSYGFKLPPAAEQIGIEAILTALDDRIALLRETNASLEAIAQALFKSWFVDFDPVRAKQQGLAPAGMDEATAALFADSFEESALGLVPRAWGTGKVEDLLELAYGKALKANDRVAGEVPVYGSGGVTGLHNRALVGSPTVVVGRKGTVGSLYWEDRPCFPIDTVFYVQARVPLTFCFYQLRVLGLEGMNTDGAVPGLNRNNVYRLAVVIPPPPVLAAFDDLAANLRSKIFANETQAQTLATLRDTLLPRLISGQLRLPQAEALTS